MDEIEGPPEFMFIDSPFVTISDAGNQFNSDSVVIPEDATNSHDSLACEIGLQNDSNSHTRCATPEASNANEIVEEALTVRQFEVTKSVLKNLSNISKDAIKRTKRAYPSVATSEEWGEIFRKAEQDKIEKEEAKRRRIEEREEKR
ncbi:uncharacterized protein LOC110678093 [Aedes aegypti]|uniref:Uncharacterized protein n=1 Tax=Aedes aegypti TaxID=7159 RepID=A0A6I8U5M6_AEDAE|nr:uncharacterized protein LOC110678093 [Aedes aegypti]